MISFAGAYLEGNRDAVHVLRFIENVIGLSVIAIFASLDFECGICASSDHRGFSNESDNKRILIYFVMGCFAAIIEAITYCIMRVNGVIEMED